MEFASRFGEVVAVSTASRDGFPDDYAVSLQAAPSVGEERAGNERNASMDVVE